MQASSGNEKHFVLDEAVAQATIGAVEEAFSTLMDLKVKVGAHSIERGFVNRGDISGIIGMVQSRMEANFTISFDQDTIIAMMSKMYGKTFTEIDSSVRQGVGELTNIIYALIKRALNERGYSFKMAIPNIVFGINHSIVNIHDGRSLVFPFSTEHGKFMVEIAVQQNQGIHQ